MNTVFKIGERFHFIIFHRALVKKFGFLRMWR